MANYQTLFVIFLATCLFLISFIADSNRTIVSEEFRRYKTEINGIEKNASQIPTKMLSFSKASTVLSSVKPTEAITTEKMHSDKMIWTPPRTLKRRQRTKDTQNDIHGKVTVLVFSSNEETSCLSDRISKILSEYPKVRIIVASSNIITNHTNITQSVEHLNNVPTEGMALQRMLAKVKTDYFLYLASGVTLATNDTDTSIDWLRDALDQLPELDFVGGSYLRKTIGAKYPVLEIPCYRLRLCAWTMSQSFEYQYSIGDMMVCEETSSSFMGRMSSLAKVGQFDQQLDTMATTDFFLRAKGKALVATRPEVRFLVNEPCVPDEMSPAQEADAKFYFMKKRQLLILRDSFGKEVAAKDSSKYGSLNYRDKLTTYGNPFLIKGILHNLEVAADFLESKDIPYQVDFGSALGAVKMRAILPWDLDADLQFYGDFNTARKDLIKYLKDKNITGFTNKHITENKQLRLRLLAGPHGYVEMFAIKDVTPDPSSFMYIHIHGRKYPVSAKMFSMIRREYGPEYLEMWPNYGKPKKCVYPDGHHACLPKEYMNGGGHWRDFDCEL